MALIVISVAMMVIEVQYAEAKFAHILEYFSDAITVLFVAELLTRYYVARSKKRFFRQYWIDIIAVIPFLRSLRFLRLLRLLRLFRMGVILTRRLASMSTAFRGASREYMIMGLIIVIVVMAGGIGIRVTEHGNAAFASLEQTLWWSVFTLVAGEPIGGEPNSHLGRFFALVMMVAGLTLFAMFTGIVSAVMVNRLRSFNMRNLEIDELKDHIVICGWNRSTLKLLDEFGKDRDTVERGIVLVGEFDKEPDMTGLSIDPHHVFIVSGDFTQGETLDRCNIDRAAIAIILADRTKPRSDQDIDARTVLSAIVIERRNPDIFTSVELLSRANGAHLTAMGVEEIVVGEEYTGGLLAMATRNRGILRLMEELHAHEGNSFHKLDTPARLVGKTVGAVAQELREKHDAILVAIYEAVGADGGVALRTNPPGGTKIPPASMLVVIAQKPPAL